jgi:hypothetical protein
MALFSAGNGYMICDLLGYVDCGSVDNASGSWSGDIFSGWHFVQSLRTARSWSNVMRFFPHGPTQS